ncbi:HNH endonuclease [Thermanaerosceptrum fracticalcis]|uniref:Putative HNH nuclease YajD n=2 Tax=Thermanaerosceptrum fracticalcis TaxID=1712410 RepID=A0A7G6E8W2_THEFR|nr:HNH endonuclease signature motif containing protein [Thermanaerosceptrum fracticalcis]QNB48516.1 HNH endonuclease [Thermanaerosceptrum fracticalcis]
MPTKSKRPCSWPGCPELTTERYCEKHKKQEQRRQDERRGTAAQRGYDARWRKARKRFLSANPLCAECMKQGKIVPAIVVDHIRPHKGDYELFWDESNWQPLCKQCHDRKTATEDSNFARGRGV